MISRLAVTAMLIVSGCPVVAHGQDRAAAEATAAAISYLRWHKFADDVPVSFNVRGDSRTEGDIARAVARTEPRARQDAIRCAGSPQTCRMAPGILAHYDVIDARPVAAGMVVQLVSNRIAPSEITLSPEHHGSTAAADACEFAREIACAGVDFRREQVVRVDVVQCAVLDGDAVQVIGPAFAAASA